MKLASRGADVAAGSNREMILQRPVIGGVFVSVQPDASLGWHLTVNRTS
jgi:hypothetical protein